MRMPVSDLCLVLLKLVLSQSPFAGFLLVVHHETDQTTYPAIA
ncbi:MAG: hypothetical protein HNEKOMLI_00102 [Sodalis sp. Psp]|nr:hypothetical protein [Sodalis sp. Psp]MCR3756607.1 hypothetical protein [Sodalis sp. Ppy]